LVAWMRLVDASYDTSGNLRVPWRKSPKETNLAAVGGVKHCLNVVWFRWYTRFIML
jgi:hypothetical protein